MTAHPRPRYVKALAAAATVPLLAGVTFAAHAGAASTAADPAATSAGTGPTSGNLPPANFTVASTVKINLDDHFVRLPLHRGEFQGKAVWYTLTDASDQAVADELGLNFSPKLANLAAGCPACVQQVTLRPKSGAVFDEAVVQFEGVPDFSPTRVLKPGPAVFPPAVAEPGAVGDAKYSPFFRVAGTNTVYNASIVAVGDGPFDVEHHSNTAERVLAVHPAAKDTGQAQFHGASVDLLFVTGFNSGKPIVYLSNEAFDATTAVLERATYVPLLDRTPFTGGDDFLGSARERIFPFVNGRTGSGPQAQGLKHLILDGHAAQDAALSNRPLIDALRTGGDALNVQGDFPTLQEANRRASYSPLWEAQFGEWTAKAVREGRDVRQTDEFQILNLAKNRPDLLTGPGGVPYGSVKGLINCPVIAFLGQEPKADLVQPLPGADVATRGSYFLG